MKARGVGLVVLLLVMSNNGYGQVNWTRDEANPVVSAWDGNYTSPVRLWQFFDPSVMMDPETGVFRMWFGSRAIDASSNAVSTAMSIDGQSWFVYHKNPVLTGGSALFETQGITNAFVLHDGSEYKMYYSGNNGLNMEIGLATSPDGINWTKYAGNPVVHRGESGSWDAVFAAYPQVIFDGALYHMWYGGYDGQFSRTGYATSADGILWEKFGGNPVLSEGEQGSWEDLGSSVAGVVKVGTTYFMVYRGNNAHDPKVGLGLATSPDGILWTRHPANPVLQPSIGGWDAYQLSGGALLYFGDLFHLWYCASAGSSVWQGGYATSPLSTTAVPRESPLPSQFALLPGYPNPFNPETHITYSIPHEELVNISIYDALGRLVKTLVNERKPVGTYRVTWNASAKASGTYWVRMIAGGFHKTTKLTVLR